MRIVAGLYGGRRLQVPKNRDIRPTSDKVRGAIFNALHSRGGVDGARVLDAFCGTGALGLEALSRGASHCTFMDKARVSLDLAKMNAKELGVDAADFILKDATKLPACDALYDLVFLDPPYNQDLVSTCLGALHDHSCLSDGAIIVAETERAYLWLGDQSYEILDERAYGETKVSYLRYAKAPQ